MQHYGKCNRKRYAMIAGKTTILLVSFAVIAVFQGCSKEETNPTSSLPASTREFAMGIAQEHVTSVADLSSGASWSNSSVVNEAFPIHIDGKDGISYYECKVTTNGLDAGFVLVNVDTTDRLIAEDASEGLTITEQYREALGTDEITVYRYDWFVSAATTQPSSAEGLAKSLTESRVASIGFDGQGKIRLGSTITSADLALIKQISSNYRNVVQEKGCFPQYDRQMLLQYFTVNCADGLGKSAELVATEYEHQLLNSFPCGLHLPSYTQPQLYGHAIGCGPAAWAMVFAYWRQFKGMAKLFDGVDIYYMCYSYHSDDYPIYDCMKYVYEAINTTGVGDAGFTWPEEMPKATAYPKKYGYASTCSKINCDEWEKYDYMKPEIVANKPMVLLIHDDGIGIPNHYVGIEGVRKKRIKNIFNQWRNDELAYLANFGWGGTRKWIYVKDVGINNHAIYTSSSLYTINIQ